MCRESCNVILEIFLNIRHSPITNVIVYLIDPYIFWSTNHITEVPQCDQPDYDTVSNLLVYLALISVLNHYSLCYFVSLHPLFYLCWLFPRLQRDVINLSVILIVIFIAIYFDGDLCLKTRQNYHGHLAWIIISEKLYVRESSVHDNYVRQSAITINYEFPYDHPLHCHPQLTTIIAWFLKLLIKTSLVSV